MEHHIFGIKAGKTLKTCRLAQSSVYFQIMNWFGPVDILVKNHHKENQVKYIIYSKIIYSGIIIIFLHEISIWSPTNQQ